MTEVQRELAMLLTVVLLLLPWLHQADTSVSTAHPFMHSGLCSEARSAWLLPFTQMGGIFCSQTLQCPCLTT